MTADPRLTRAEIERIRTEAVVYGCSHTNVADLADTALDAMKERDEANLAAHANNGKAILAEQDLRTAEARNDALHADAAMLRIIIGRLNRALRDAWPTVDSMLCPSVFWTGTPPLHVELCERIRALLGEPQEEKP